MVGTGKPDEATVFTTLRRMNFRGTPSSSIFITHANKQLRNVESSGSGLGEGHTQWALDLVCSFGVGCVQGGKKSKVLQGLLPWRRSRQGVLGPSSVYPSINSV